MSELRRRFEIDHEYDRDNADMGTPSRYGNYLNDRTMSFLAVFNEGWEDPTVEFALTAWRIATGPIMSPGLVRFPNRVLGVKIVRSEWDGEAVVDAELICPRPTVLANAKDADGRYFGDWSLDAWGDYTAVGGQEVAKASYLFTKAQVLWRIPPGTLPRVTSMPAGSGQLFDRAVECVEGLTAQLNRHLGPLLDLLDPEGSDRW
jgi:hypothetical protein